MLELTPTGALSWSFHVREDGSEVSFLQLSRFKSAGSFTCAGRGFDVKREGLFGAIVLVAEDREIARAERTSLLPAKFRIRAEDRHLTVAARGVLPRTAVIFHGDVVVGTIRRASLLRRTVIVETAQAVPLQLAIFCAAVMILHWRRSARAARS